MDEHSIKKTFVWNKGKKGKMFKKINFFSNKNIIKFEKKKERKKNVI